jgi:hypothetical protein
METITRLVTESLARHGFDRPVDFRRLQWSTWFRCESHRSLLHVPSKPGVFALAEEVTDFGTTKTHVATAAMGCPAEPSEAENVEERRLSATLEDDRRASATVEERPFRAASGPTEKGASAPAPRRMLAVTQFFEDDDMAFVLDRMLTWTNPMRARLSSGRYFIRYVVLQDESQRRSICAALNQWIANSAEKTTGIGAHFATSLEVTEANVAQKSVAPANVARTLLSASAEATEAPAFQPNPTPAAPSMHSGAATNIHCPSPFPSGF